MIDQLVAAKPKVLSYPGLRRAGGYLGIALPFVLIIGQMILSHSVTIERSLSAYYYTDMRNIFVGDLCAIAVFLVSCKGYSRPDAIAGDLSGLFAVGVAFFPTNPGADKTLIGTLHGIFASLLFLTLAFFCLVLFRKTAPGNTPTHRKLKRNKVYTICGYTMVACIVLALVTGISRIKDFLGWENRLFWFESIAIVAFGIAWLTKGEKILSDNGEPSAVTSD